MVNHKTSGFYNRFYCVEGFVEPEYDSVQVLKPLLTRFLKTKGKEKREKEKFQIENSPILVLRSPCVSIMDQKYICSSRRIDTGSRRWHSTLSLCTGRSVSLLNGVVDWRVVILSPSTPYDSLFLHGDYPFLEVNKRMLTRTSFGIDCFN